MAYNNGEVQPTWRNFPDSSDAVLGTWKVGRVETDPLHPGTWRVVVKLPGVQERCGSSGTLDEAKAHLVKIVNYWFTNTALPLVDESELTKRVEKVDKAFGKLARCCTHKSGTDCGHLDQEFNKLSCHVSNCPLIGKP